MGWVGSATDQTWTPNLDQWAPCESSSTTELLFVDFGNMKHLKQVRISMISSNLQPCYLSHLIFCFNCHNFPDTLDQYDMTLMIAMDLVLSLDLIRLSSHVFHPFPSRGDLERLLPSGRSQTKKRVRATASDVSPATKSVKSKGGIRKTYGV